MGGSGGITLCSYCGAPCRFVHLVLSCIAPLRTQIYYRYRDIRALFNYVYTDFVFAIAGQTLSCILMYTSGACFGPKNLHTSSSTHTLKKKLDHQIIALKLSFTELLMYHAASLKIQMYCLFINPKSTKIPKWSNAILDLSL